MQDHETGLSAEDAKLLLPWHGAGTLAPQVALQIDAMLSSDATLKRMFAAIQCERDEVVALNEGLGRPSPRVLASVFASIDADTAARKISL